MNSIFFIIPTKTKEIASVSASLFVLVVILVDSALSIIRVPSELLFVLKESIVENTFIFNDR